MARNPELCDKLRQIKEESGLSYTELSNITGLSADMLKKYVLGCRVPSEFHIRAIETMIKEYH